jgi:hypothetical protein
VELQQNQKYIQMVISQDENDKRRQKEEEALAAKKRKEVQAIQVMQMGSNSPAQGPSDAATSYNSIARRGTANVGSHMTVEELRINKGILREISRKKKIDISSQAPEQSIHSAGYF